MPPYQWRKAAAHWQKARLEKARQLDFLSHALALLGSPGTLLLLVSFGKDVKTITAAVCSLFGSICVAASASYRNGTTGSRNNISSVYIRLTGVVSELTFLSGRLVSFKDEDLAEARNNSEALQLIRHAELLCKNVRLWSAEVPGGCLKGEQIR